MIPNKPKYLYIAFDLFPSRKGAATHIYHCLKALKAQYGTGILFCLGNDDMPKFQFDEESDLYIVRFKDKIVNFLERTVAFQQQLQTLLNNSLCSQLALIHFRDIWGGQVALKTSSSIKKVFEVNSFQSIELPTRYAGISINAITQIKAIEKENLNGADAIITPSLVTKKHIENEYNIQRNKVTVIQNGVTIINGKTKPSEIQKPYFLYFGALQKWQGIKILFKALKEIYDLDIKLVICSSISEKRAVFHQKLAEDIGVSSKILWYFELDKLALSGIIKNALFTVAPLSQCDRNLIQGCNPLKIIESMGYGIPVIASDIPVATCLINDNVDGFLVQPDRPELLGRKIRQVLADSKRIKKYGTAAKKKMNTQYHWKQQELKMTTVYKQLSV
ncbi:glycosyltransferase family 4 protein [Spongiivirga citrea]|uniref:Glycosyltransferase n=1 Tax=Spongiivirga citrea TaxID=1481457 RepID=A0A6M0CHW6_9FLAO|nr:glycosyltransferase family 4 protein [Spongiivirga citrea]NER16543.1 glycosyltransferase [Spongiivirga citrea]